MLMRTPSRFLDVRKLKTETRNTATRRCRLRLCVARTCFKIGLFGNKAANAALREDLHLHREAASNAAALESLDKSAVERKTSAVWSRPEVANFADSCK